LLLGLLGLYLLHALFGPVERKAFFVKEALYIQYQIYVAPAVDPLLGEGFLGAYYPELALPVPENVGLYLREGGHLAYLEIELVRYLRYLRHRAALELVV